jgi:hypothetical protein
MYHDIFPVHCSSVWPTCASIYSGSRRRSKTSEVSLSSTTTGSVDVSLAGQGVLLPSSGSSELYQGRSTTALSATDEENMDVDSVSTTQI